MGMLDRINLDTYAQLENLDDLLKRNTIMARALIQIGKLYRVEETEEQKIAREAIQVLEKMGSI